jgi:hypothetical protein
MYYYKYNKHKIKYLNNYYGGSLNTQEQNENLDDIIEKLSSTPMSMYTNIRNNEDIAKGILDRDIKFIKLLGFNIRSNKNIMLNLVKQDGLLLMYADNNLLQDKETVMTAVQQNGLALEFAKNILKRNREIVLAAIKNNEKAIYFIDKILYQDGQFLLDIVYQINYKIIKFLYNNLLNLINFEEIYKKFNNIKDKIDFIKILCQIYNILNKDSEEIMLINYIDLPEKNNEIKLIKDIQNKIKLIVLLFLNDMKSFKHFITSDDSFQEIRDCIMELNDLSIIQLIKFIKKK